MASSRLTDVQKRRRWNIILPWNVADRSALLDGETFLQITDYALSSVF
jgi:hypothetical protein